MHLKLRQAGVPADLIVFEGLSHAQYHMALMPEADVSFHRTGPFFRQEPPLAAPGMTEAARGRGDAAASLKRKGKGR